MILTHGSLFSGIGGFDLAAQWMGWENIFHCEWNEFGQRVLKYYWPNAITYGDITKTDFAIHRGRIDILTGGFPCQPFSAAGKRKGKDDDRYLWPEMLRAIREIQPSWIIGENVAGIISMVQPGSETPVESQATFFEADNKETILEQEYVIETICSDLEREGYSVQPILIPACGVGAPHRRDRVWFIAHTISQRKRELQSIRTGENTQGFRGENPCGLICTKQNGITPNTESKGSKGLPERTGTENTKHGVACSGGATTDTNGCRRGKGSMQGELRSGLLIKSPFNSRLSRQTEDGEGQEGSGWIETITDTEPERRKRGDIIRESIRFESGAWDNWPTVEPTICRNNDGLSSRLSGITFSKHRNESIKAYGNAIVPQVAYQIFKAIEQIS